MHKNKDMEDNDINNQFDNNNNSNTATNNNQPFIEDESDVDKSFGSKWMTDRIERRKKYFVTATIILLLLAVSIIFYFMRMDKLDKQRKSAASQQIIVLREELKSYEQELVNIREEYGNTINGKSCIMLAFTNLAKGDAKNVLQLMDERGYCGLIVFTDGRTPGDVNCISIELYQELIDKGWQAAIGSSSSVALKNVTPDSEITKWESYVKSVQNEFIEKGLECPDIYCFNEGENYSVVAPLFDNLGIRMYIPVFNDGEESWFSAEEADGTLLNGVQADYNYKEIRTDINKYTDMGYSTVILFNRIEFGYPQDNLSTYTSYSRFEEIIDCIEQTSRESYITTVDGYEAYQAELDATMTGERAEYNEKRDAIMDEITTIQSKIDKLRKDAGY